MAYPKIPDLKKLADAIVEYSRLKHEYGAQGVQNLLEEAELSLKNLLERFKELPISKELSSKEPNLLSDIKNLRKTGSRRLWNSFDKEKYKDKLEGALLSRFAACTLGAAVEFWNTKSMEDWAEYTGDQFPPVDYWSKTKHPNVLRYEKSIFQAYTRDGMDGVPVDDDITYTILGLLITEEYGMDFTTSDVGRAWVKYLPSACTAEEVALENLKLGIHAEEVADINNPYCQWIGADIRSDPWAYIAPAYPEKAAEMAYRDAFLSHRRNGIYGEMFFSAAQSAAFAVDNAVDALKIGLTEIPKECSLYKDITWALNVGKDVKSYKDVRNLINERFLGMTDVHTNNNACLTVFGLMIGGNDVTKVISETVAMGDDNDCTAATAGSIVGAIVGKNGVPNHWYKNFNNKVITYMTGAEIFKIDDLIERFTVQAEKIYGDSYE